MKLSSLIARCGRILPIIDDTLKSALRVVGVCICMLIIDRSACGLSVYSHDFYHYSIIDCKNLHIPQMTCYCWFYWAQSSTESTVLHIYYYIKFIFWILHIRVKNITKQFWYVQKLAYVLCIIFLFFFLIFYMKQLHRNFAQNYVFSNSEHCKNALSTFIFGCTVIGTECACTHILGCSSNGHWSMKYIPIQVLLQCTIKNIIQIWMTVFTYDKCKQ